MESFRAASRDMVRRSDSCPISRSITLDVAVYKGLHIMSTGSLNEPAAILSVSFNKWLLLHSAYRRKFEEGIPKICRFYPKIERKLAHLRMRDVRGFFTTTAFLKILGNTCSVQGAESYSSYRPNI